MGEDDVLGDLYSDVPAVQSPAVVLPPPRRSIVLDLRSQDLYLEEASSASVSKDIDGDSTPQIPKVAARIGEGDDWDSDSGDDSSRNVMIGANDDDDDHDDDDDQFKMSVESDSSDSDCDDLAAFLENELDSESEDDAEVANQRLKRQKLEHIETYSEQISEASSSKGACKHFIIGKLCGKCGQNFENCWEETGVVIRYTHMDMRLDPDEISKLRDSDMRALHRQRKLCLVLDLDHTLLNTTQLRELKEEEMYLKNHTHSLRDVSGGYLFMLECMGMMTKLRPFVHTFLKEASQMFILYIHTMGDRPYALQMAKLLDPKGEYFGDRIISRGDNTVKNRKSLDVVLEHKSSILILDDTENAWPNYKDHLIVIERYHFFASSCKQFELNYQSLSQLMSDESEQDGSLAAILRVLKHTHSLFFEDGVEDLSGRDVRLIIKQVRRDILKGCRLVFSRVFQNHSKPEDHPLWRMAEGLGAICATEVDASVTHVVAMERRTKKVHWARKEKKFVVHRGWIEAAYYLWKKQPEEKFALEQLKKQATEVTSDELMIMLTLEKQTEEEENIGLV